MRSVSWIKSTLVLLWLGCVAWLVRYEAYPQWFEASSKGYRDLLADAPAVSDAWMRVLVGGKHVGYAHSSMEMEEHEGVERITLGSMLYLRMCVVGQLQHFRIQTRVHLDTGMRLTSFRVMFYFDDFRGEMEGTRVEDDAYRLEGNLGSLPISRTIRLPRNSIIFSPYLESGMRRLRKGEKMHMSVTDPLTAQTRLLHAEGNGDEQILLYGESEPRRAHRVTMTLDQVQMVAWVDDMGRVLRQEGALGLVFEHAPTSTAIGIPSDNCLNPQDLGTHGGEGSAAFPFISLPTERP